MKVIIITNHTEQNVGYGRFSADLIKFLEKNGNEVLLICNKTNVNLKHIKQISVLPSMLDFKKLYFFPWVYLLKLFTLRKELKKYDAIHCVIESYSFFAFLLGKFTGVRYVLHAHGSYGVLFFNNKIYGFLQKISYRNAKSVICVSNYTKNKILKYGKFINLIVVPNGVNLELFGKALSEKKEKNILLSVGAFKKRKGFDLAIKAMPAVKKEFPEIKYYIIGGAGDDYYYDYLVDLAKELGVEKNVVFLRNILDKELKELYQRAEIFILTTVSEESNFDGFGMVYLEANAYGAPVIGSYDSGAEEAIRNGYNGFLTRPKDTEDIAQKILMLLKDNELRKKISENALNWAKKLSWDNTVKEYINIYRR